MVIVHYTKETYEEAKQVQRVLEQSKIPSRMEAYSEAETKNIDVFVTKDSPFFDDSRWYCAKLGPAAAKRLLAASRPVNYRPFDSAYAQQLFGQAEDIPEVLEIPDDCNSILAHTFSYLDRSVRVKKIVIPETVTEIGSGAFDKILITESISIPSSVKSIGRNAFKLKKGAIVLCTADSCAKTYCRQNYVDYNDGFSTLRWL